MLQIQISQIFFSVHKEMCLCISVTCIQLLFVRAETSIPLCRGLEWRWPLGTPLGQAPVRLFLNQQSKCFTCQDCIDVIGKCSWTFDTKLFAFVISLDKSSEEADSTKEEAAKMEKEYEVSKDSTKNEGQNAAGNSEESRGTEYCFSSK